MAMTCPVDGTELKMSERQGVEIDYCPQCSGGLGRPRRTGQIIDRSEQVVDRERESEPARAYDAPGDYERPRDSYPSRDYDDDDDRRHRGRKRKGWLGEMFEFGD